MSVPAQGTGRVELLDEIERFLRDAVESFAAKQPVRRGPGAPLVLPWLTLWVGLLLSVLRGFRSQSQLWRLLTQYGVWSYPRVEVCEQAVRNRLAQGGDQMERLFGQISQVLTERLAPYEDRSLASFAKKVVAIDETKLDPLARKLPMLQDGKIVDPPQLPGKLATRLNVRTQQWERAIFEEKATQNEKALARPLIEDLEAGSLVLFDLGFFAFQWFDELTEKGLFWVSRLREGTSYEILHVFHEEGQTLDALIWLGKYRADRAGHMVRLVQFEVGGVVKRYITNVLSPLMLPMWEIAVLYGRRWDVEMGFRLLKRELNLHLLWSGKTEVIQQQIWAALTIAQVLQGLRTEIAGRARVSVFDVSMRLMIEALPQFALRGEDPVQTLVERGHDAKIIRPSRRLKMQAPVIGEDQITPVPEGLVFTRKARHANRKCGPRPPEPREKAAKAKKPPGNSACPQWLERGQLS